MSGDRVSMLIANCPDSHAEIAAKLGVDKSLVTRFRSQKRKPTAAQVAKLEELYGTVTQRQVTPAAVAAPISAPDEEDEEVGDGEGNARLRRMIRSGMREIDLDPDLSGVKKAEALKKLVDAQVALDKSTGENALTMQRIAAHPEFVRVVRLITEALAPFPAALSEVIRVLEVNR